MGAVGVRRSHQMEGMNGAQTGVGGVDGGGNGGGGGVGLRRGGGDCDGWGSLSAGSPKSSATLG